MPLEYSTTPLTQCTDFEAPKPKYLESQLEADRAEFIVKKLPDFPAFVEHFSQALAHLSMVRKSRYEILAQQYLMALNGQLKNPQ
jgi:hypothetical protein